MVTRLSALERNKYIPFANKQQEDSRLAVTRTLTTKIGPPRKTRLLPHRGRHTAATTATVFNVEDPVHGLSAPATVKLPLGNTTACGQSSSVANQPIGKKSVDAVELGLPVLLSTIENAPSMLVPERGSSSKVEDSDDTFSISNVRVTSLYRFAPDSHTSRNLNNLKRAFCDRLLASEPLPVQPRSRPLIVDPSTRVERYASRLNDFFGPGDIFRGSHRLKRRRLGVRCL